MTHRALAILVAGLTLSGCASTLVSTDRIASSTTDVLGQPPGSVRIVDRRGDGLTNTYYTAITRTGVTYRCTLDGGSFLDFGLTNPPNCVRL